MKLESQINPVTGTVALGAAFSGQLQHFSMKLQIEQH